MKYKIPIEVYLISSEKEAKLYQYMKQALRCFERWEKEGKNPQLITYVRSEDET